MPHDDEFAYAPGSLAQEAVRRLEARVKEMEGRVARLERAVEAPK